MKKSKEIKKLKEDKEVLINMLHRLIGRYDGPVQIQQEAIELHDRLAPQRYGHWYYHYEEQRLKEKELEENSLEEKYAA